MFDYIYIKSFKAEFFYLKQCFKYKNKILNLNFHNEIPNLLTKALKEYLLYAKTVFLMKCKISKMFKI